MSAMKMIEVYTQNGLRKVRPYYNKRSAFVKGRWLGKPLVDILANEFKLRSRDYYLEQIEKGTYKLIRDGVPLAANRLLATTIKNHDILETTTHKHEPPVKQWCSQAIEADDSAGRIAGFKVVFEDESILVIDKPCGVPVHPTGQFYQNTITELLKSHGVNALPCYRLDKITSGLLILAKNSQSAGEIQKNIRSRDMSKFYLARVRGKFPHSDSVLNNEKAVNVIFQDSSNTTVEMSPIYSIDPKRQFPVGLSASRDAITQFYPIMYIPHVNETVIACKPITGRTHQIRIHLARLGHPIVNDSVYCLHISKYPERLKFMMQFPGWENQPGLDTENLRIMFQRFIEESRNICQTKKTYCPECDTVELNDPLLSDLELCLHAWRYEDTKGKFKFQTELPNWAQLSSN
ncbi:pus6p [Saccharomyces arboricola H-6]|uniref:Pus6p n=1 Tax=Saccharomyces arboricola (strain H-6 / AS 2.3317 / CBS 10644) TaxID=1160507 RepID=J8Q4I2_SACAR|nr:pus6p [Saccharomyces arboricola H-6]